jgi:hypothetical protein
MATSGAIHQEEETMTLAGKVAIVSGAASGVGCRSGELDALQMIARTTSRAHRRAAGKMGPVPGARPLRGGFTTKIHLRCNAVGMPIGVVLRDGAAHDVTAYDELMARCHPPRSA